MRYCKDISDNCSKKLKPNQRSQVRLFSGAAFISAEFTDISFEVKAVLCFIFYAFGDVFRRTLNVQQDCIVGN